MNRSSASSETWKLLAPSALGTVVVRTARLVVLAALQLVREVVDLEAGRVRMRVDVAPPVAEFLRAGVVGVAQRLRGPDVSQLVHVSGRVRERADDGVRLRRAGEVERGLRQVQLRLRQPDVLERLRRRDG